MILIKFLLTLEMVFFTEKEERNLPKRKLAIYIKYKKFFLI